MQPFNFAILTTSLLSGLSTALPTSGSYQLAAQQRSSNPISDNLTRCMYPAVNICLPKDKAPQNPDQCIYDAYKSCATDTDILFIAEDQHKAFAKDVRIGWAYCLAKKFRSGVNAWALEARCQREQMSKALSKHLGLPEAVVLTSDLQAVNEISTTTNMALDEDANLHQLASRQSAMDTKNELFKRWYHCAQYRWHCFRKTFQYDCEESRKECGEGIHSYEPPH